MIEVPLRCSEAFGVVGTPADGGEEDTAEEEVLIRGLNISTIDDRRRFGGIGGDGGGFGTDIVRRLMVK